VFLNITLKTLRNHYMVNPGFLLQFAAEYITQIYFELIFQQIILKKIFENFSSLYINSFNFEARRPIRVQNYSRQ